MRLLILSSLSLVAASLAHANDINTSAPYKLSERQKADIVRQVKDKLKDGESARWRWPLHQPRYGLYCGWVNSKNSYGGYAGWTPYSAVGGTTSTDPEYKIVIVTIIADDDLSTAAASVCRRYGYDLSEPPPE